MKALSAITFMLLPLTAFSATKTTTCEVDVGHDSYEGQCIVIGKKGGSFSIQKPAGEILEGITNISVNIVSSRIAEVRALNIYGTNPYWGKAVRSQTDKSCWIGKDFEICIR